MSKWFEYAEAFTIFAKYGNRAFAVHAEHDELFAGPHPSKVSEEDRARLEELGWRIDDFGEGFAKLT